MLGCELGGAVPLRNPLIGNEANPIPIVNAKIKPNVLMSGVYFGWLKPSV